MYVFSGRNVAKPHGIAVKRLLWGIWELSVELYALSQCKICVIRTHCTGKFNGNDKIYNSCIKIKSIFQFEGGTRELLLKFAFVVHKHSEIGAFLFWNWLNCDTHLLCTYTVNRNNRIRYIDGTKAKIWIMDLISKFIVESRFQNAFLLFKYIGCALWSYKIFI